MTKINEIYKCTICGNIVEVLHDGMGELVCCGQPMLIMKQQNQDLGQEKHVPVIEDTNVKVGSTEHPMTPEHYIEWIEAVEDNVRSKKQLSPTDKPEAQFCFKPKKARAYCNVHGLWTSTQ